MEHIRWAQQVEPQLDGKSIVGVLLVNLFAFLATAMLARTFGLSVPLSIAFGFRAWALAILGSYAYWLLWMHRLERFKRARRIALIAALVLLALHAIAALIVLDAGAKLAILA